MDDYQLGQRIGALLTEPSTSGLSVGAIFSQVQDLLGADTTLLGPIRDLLNRPAFRQLFRGDRQPVLLGGRDALLQDLSQTYHPAMVMRLALLIDGSLGLAPSASPSTPAAVGGMAGGVPASATGWGVAHGMPSQTSAWPSAPAQPPYSLQPPHPGPGAPPMAAPPMVIAAPAAGSGPNAITALLIVLVSLLFGGLLVGLGWLLLSSRPSLQSAAPATPAPAPSTASQSPASSPPSPKDAVTPTPPSTPSGAWGSAAEYKFGTLPGGDYPSSCAFSQTDAAGQKTLDKAQLEYWACRDIGGDAQAGYRVAWSDGKETTYTFQQNGNGQVVGTNGSTYPMTWRNDSHNGSDIIVINHQDGAISWIPGHVQ